MGQLQKKKREFPGPGWGTKIPKAGWCGQKKRGDGAAVGVAPDNPALGPSPTHPTQSPPSHRGQDGDWAVCPQGGSTPLWSSIFFFFFLFGLAACGILVPRPGIEPVLLAVKVRSPNHWTARELPLVLADGDFPDQSKSWGGLRGEESCGLCGGEVCDPTHPTLVIRQRPPEAPSLISQCLLGQGRTGGAGSTGSQSTWTPPLI